MNNDSARRLGELEHGATSDAVFALFDDLPAVRVEEILGRWRGSEIPTGHPMNGLLGPLGWYGKEFVDAETVHPLLFQDARGAVFTVDPRKLPTGMAPRAARRVAGAGGRMLALMRSVVGTEKPRARLRHVEVRGKVSAAMVYDHLPIIDAFRRVDATTLLGAMDQRGDAEPLFFVLRRERERSPY